MKPGRSKLPSSFAGWDLSLSITALIPSIASMSEPLPWAPGADTQLQTRSRWS